MHARTHAHARTHTHAHTHTHTHAHTHALAHTRTHTSKTRALRQVDSIDRLPTRDPTKMEVTQDEAFAFREWLGYCGSRQPVQRERASFVGHFQWFDSLSKEPTSRIPPTNLAEVQALVEDFFPGGLVVW